LRTEANAVVTPIHPKAVVVVLTRLAEFDHWLEADTVETPRRCSGRCQTARCGSSLAGIGQAMRQERLLPP
jgi:putative SOS response-associated peptidase YedK